MRIEHLVDAVRSGKAQPSGDLEQFVEGVADGSVTIEDATSWLKAVHQHGMNTEDTVVLTKSMIASGASLSWGEGPPVVDKHSTGGVGDKMSLVLAPALAAAGCRVPMLAGRGLGHTGGTIDKLEAIPGFNCALSPEAMVEAVNAVGCCIAVQNDAIAPADGVLYAIRDVTHTIDSVPLITASIISKKAAEGLTALVLDVKTGSAAFMQTVDQARELATSMVRTAEGLGINTVAQLTTMDQPIGTHIGNALEVIGSIRVLQGGGSPDTRELVVLQGAALLCMTGVCENEDEARSKMKAVLTNGAALDRFRAMCVQQGVEPGTAKALVNLPERVLGVAEFQTCILAEEDGYVEGYDAMKLAQLARRHGAGRFALEDVIDPLVGAVIDATVGQAVKKNAPLLTFHHTRPLGEDELGVLKSLVNLSPEAPVPTRRLIEVIDSTSTKA
ncbi:MAG: thymidine phosphorylase [Candidatus Poseidoniales archaeon]